MKKALYVTLIAKPGCEQAVSSFLKAGLAVVNKERDTIAWFALRMSPSMFAIFDVFENDAGRDAHLTGDLAQLLLSRADELFVAPPSIQKIDVISSKLSSV